MSRLILEDGSGFLLLESAGGYLLLEQSVGATLARSARKPKKRRYVFDNGITVWATSEAMARLVAGLDIALPAPTEGAGAVQAAAPPVEAVPPAEPAPAPSSTSAQGEAAGPSRADVAAEMARFERELAEKRELARLARLRAEEAAILMLLLDEAA
jgi:hypothetical protein